MAVLGTAVIEPRFPQLQILEGTFQDLPVGYVRSNRIHRPNNFAIDSPGIDLFICSIHTIQLYYDSTMNQVRNKVWTRTALKNPHRLGDKRRRIQEMFSAIAGTYDLLNHFLSLNLDRRWRRKAANLAQMKPGQKVLDLCCGTGDLAITFAELYPALQVVVGVDFVETMLDIATHKLRTHRNKQNIDRCNLPYIIWLCSDVECLPFADRQFDCVSCAFGIRNLQNLLPGLRESFRVLKSGGQLVILEFAMPKHRWSAWLYGGYFRLVLPLIGSIIAKDAKGAYHYLPESVRSFSSAEELTETIRKAGFEAIHVETLSGGIVAAYVARKS